MKLNYPEIKDWSICELPLDNWYYVAPECRHTCIHGAVYGNPKFADGKYVNTSTIQRFIYEQGLLLKLKIQSIFLEKKILTKDMKTSLEMSGKN